MPLIAPDFLPTQKDLVDTIIVLLAIILMGVVAYGDARKRLIPNTLTATVAILGIIRLMAIGDPIGASYTMGTAFLVSFITFLLFTRRLIGGGDVKLLIATVVLIGYHALFPFLMIMSICGAVMSIAILIMYTKSRPSVPYGVAIAVGAIVMLNPLTIG